MRRNMEVRPIFVIGMPKAELARGLSEQLSQLHGYHIVIFSYPDLKEPVFKLFSVNGAIESDIEEIKEYIKQLIE